MGDRLIQNTHEINPFQRVFQRYIEEGIISNEFSSFLCDLMKTNANLISYAIFKKKISSNLKNFKELKGFQTFNSASLMTK